jgi:hypothetical protein
MPHVLVPPRLGVPVAIVAAGFVLFALPAVALAATANITVPFAAGSPSIGTLDNASLPAISANAGTVSGAVNGGNWTDSTGTASGWHGTLQTTALVGQGPFVQTAGTRAALGSSGSGAYNGTSGSAIITVRVNGTPTMVHTPFAWTSQEHGTRTSGTVAASACSNGIACAVSRGVTITFAIGTRYPAGAEYSARVGALPANSMTIATASALAITPQGGTAGGSNLPAYQSNGSVVSAGGSAVPFVAAGRNQGMGTFSLAIGVTLTWDPQDAWTGAGPGYVGIAQYAISTGP